MFRYFPRHDKNFTQGKEWYKYRSKTQPYTLKPRTIMSYVPSMNDVAEEAL
ncbi:putative cytochrome P450 49a1-like [Tropilaelaps mercedesae]|uniref:Putative cytochrome P450 49a1-like n=1 Tax=Tropilaelaps mercedesae TaxID=418985 RepID=A0A1V9X3N0_9ACAR|nr:putative cytochrome P450 49a1-like [Tropilaelaps mercedesae]